MEDRRVPTPSDVEAFQNSSVELHPVYFNGHYGTIHRAKGHRKFAPTVLIAAPIGREGCCVYRFFFDWANDLAKCGHQVIRYDHKGTGDSQTLDPNDDQWTCWSIGLKQAAAFARNCTGSQKIVVVGLRMSALLALTTAAEIKPEYLVLLAPIKSGKAWLKELRLAAALQNLHPDAADIVVDGIKLSSPTVRTVEQVSLESLRVPCNSIFLAGADPGNEYAKMLGPGTKISPFYGYSRLFRDSHLNDAPTRVFQAAAEWLRQNVRGDEPVAAPPPPLPQRLEAPLWIESPVEFGNGLRGVVCRPRQPQQGTMKRAIAFGNTGGDPRSSLGGFTTHACRTLASAGVSSLRFDFHGLGESDSAEAARTHVYETSRRPEYKAAAELLKSLGYSDLTLIGVCTGGYHAVRAVVEGEDFRKAIVFNCWLIWRPGTPLGFRAVRMTDVIHSKSWRLRIKRLLNGDLNLFSKLPGIAYRFVQIWRVWRPDPLSTSVRDELRQASRDGKTIKIVVGQDDQARDDLEADFGRKFHRLLWGKSVSVTVLKGLDHALATDRSKALATAEIMRFLNTGPGILEASAVGIRFGRPLMKARN